MMQRSGGTQRVQRSGGMGVAISLLTFILAPSAMSCPFGDGRLFCQQTSK